jgi:hypothetical protein
VENRSATGVIPRGGDISVSPRPVGIHDSPTRSLCRIAFTTTNTFCGFLTRKDGNLVWVCPHEGCEVIDPFEVEFESRCSRQDCARATTHTLELTVLRDALRENAVSLRCVHCGQEAQPDKSEEDKIRRLVAGFKARVRFGTRTQRTVVNRGETSRPNLTPEKPMPSKLGNPNTESENLFEEYLTAHGFGKWDHEVPVEGKKKTPDYLLEHGGSKYIFEVKEFDAPLPGLGPSVYDPYRPIRAKVNEATRQFKEYKEFSCSVVLANPKMSFVQLGDWCAIVGAMLGNVGFRIPVNTVTGTANPDRIEPAYLGGGKMIDQKPRKPQNTTVSAVIVLGTYPLRRNLIRVKVKEREAVLGRRVTFEEHMAIDEATVDSANMRKVRVVVYDNPYARLPLTQEMFRGPFDERFGIQSGGDSIVRTFIGSERLRVELALKEHGISGT